MSNEIIEWDKIRHQIESSKDIQAITKMSDELEAIRVWAKQSKQSLKTQNKIAEYRLRLERKKGKWLEINKESLLSRSTDSTHLKDLGISKDESSNAQRISAITKPQFEEYIKFNKNLDKEITLTGAIRLAKINERESKIKEQINKLENNPPKVPDGKFDCIVIDPPWKYGGKYSPDSFMGQVKSPYPEMDQQQLIDLDVPGADNSIIWLWTTNMFIWDAKELLHKWGYTYKALLTWDKVNIRVGYWLRNVTEHCLLGVKGKPLWVNKRHSTIIREKSGEHSVKPEAFYDIVDEICFGRKLDYFARKKRKGWEVFGDEV